MDRMLVVAAMLAALAAPANARELLARASGDVLYHEIVAIGANGSLRLAPGVTIDEAAATAAPARRMAFDAICATPAFDHYAPISIGGALPSGAPWSIRIKLRGAPEFENVSDEPLREFVEKLAVHFACK